MNKNKGSRIKIKEDLLLDAREIQRVCELDSLTAAINMVLALYSKHLLEKLRRNISDITVVSTNFTNGSVSEGLTVEQTSSPPPPINQADTNQTGLNLRDFLRAKVRD